MAKRESESERDGEMTEVQKKSGDEVVRKPVFMGSLIPKKRKLVKQMMFETIMDSITALLQNCFGGHHPNNRARGKAKQP